MRRLAIHALLLLICLTVGQAQKVQGPAKPAGADLSWLHSFAEAYQGTSSQDIKWHAEFERLMSSSFHQRQSFWRDHGRFLTLPELIQWFIGVPGKVTLDQDRFVTIDGCVPHDCSTTGMVWIDTEGEGKPQVFFVASEDVSGGPSDQGSLQHLLIYSSTKANWQKMPPEFVASLGRWYEDYRAIWTKYYPVRAVMLTLVQPDGLTVDLSPALFHLDDTTSQQPVKHK